MKFNFEFYCCLFQTNSDYFRLFLFILDYFSIADYFRLFQTIFVYF